jgi:nitroimidazol reductase NimA-like FMN-containing flavoprotein (pyridoxamine 5'-phosphate oxidase superfamily)
MAKRRKQTALTSTAAEFVRWARVCRVATVSAEGVPHVVPVCHVLVGQKLYFGSGDDGTKVRNLGANPRVTVTVDEYSDHWDGLKGAMIQGRARLIERGPEFTRARTRLYEKYPQYPKQAALATSDSVIIEVTPTRVFTWGLK